MSAALTLHVGAALLLPGMPAEKPCAAPTESLVWLEHRAPEAAPRASTPTQLATAPTRPTREEPRRAASHTVPSAGCSADQGALAVAPTTESAATVGADEAAGALEAGAGDTAAAGIAGGQGSSGAGGSVSAPGLLAHHDPCGGYFPVDARADEGQVHIEVRVDAEGHAQASALLVESPLGQGFGQAAYACARTLRFAPARDAQGAPSQGIAKLALRFRRG